MQYPNIAQPQYGFAPTMPMMANGGSVANAQSVQSKGRGRDTMLVHMTPKEVGGLQALAMQNGGSLTINPQTGLPEAGFLENILPTLLGVGLSFIPGVGPLAAGMIVGGGTAVATGDLSKGLMAGLGAYGGAGLGAGLSSAGAAAPGAVAPTAGGIQSALTPAEIAAATGGEAAVIAGAPPVLPDPSVFPNATVTSPGGDLTYARSYTGPTAAPGAVAPNASGVVFDGTGGVPTVTKANFPAGTNVNPTTPAAPTFSSRAADAGRGIENIFTKEGGFDKFIGEAAVKADPSKGIVAAPATGLGGGTAAITKAGMAAAPALLAQPEVEMPEEEKSNYEGPYTPSARRVSYPGEEERRRSSEFTYFNPSNPIPFAEGGETAGLGALGDSISPSEARVYQNIANVQRLAGIPAIDPSRFSVAPSKGYEEFVYNPIQTGPASSGVGPEVNYGFKPIERTNDPDVTDLSSENFGFFENYDAPTPKYTFDPTSQTIAPAQSYLDAVEAARKARVPVYSDTYFKGGSVPQLENGGFVLTKKAVDGLGKGSNEKGQANAQRGLGAIPIRGAGAKRGPKAGVDDKIKTTIDGKRPALVSNGEAYVPKKQVAKKGGAKAFYALMKQAEKSADKRRRA